ncbi:MAG: hypothetical protein NZ899_03765 [Thermoguttaceae bacterium]|nr:hypothetical protein [Thermoguttaceae bacterium]MDW8077750.1 hypothetical protein [Thermoguttaceae bacterium]
MTSKELVASQASGDGKEGVVELGAALVPDGESRILVEPSDTPFHYSAVFFQGMGLRVV